MSHFAIVLGLSPTGLYVVRELGSAGVPVLGLDSSVQAGHHSKYLSPQRRGVVVPDTSALLPTLLGMAEEMGGRGVLIPTSDHYIDWIVQHATALRPHFEFQSSYNPASYASIVDKGGFSHLCQTYGLEAPPQWECSTDQFQALSREVTYPCLVKPTLIHRVQALFAGRKVLLATTAEELIGLAAPLREGDSNWLIQEVIPGPESNITLFGGYFSRNGSVMQPFTGRKLRQFPPGFGSASLARSETLAETRRLTEKFLKAVGFQGIASAEFKFDPRDGRLKILEINPRPGLWYALSHRARKRIALAAFRDLAGEPPLPEQPQQDGLIWRYLYKDLYSAAYYAWKGQGFILPAPRPGRFSAAVGPVMDPDDPQPVIGEFLNYAKKIWSRSLQRRPGRV